MVTKKKSKSKPVSKIYKKLPMGYRLIDPARSLSQARSLRKSWPDDANAIIVETKGKNGAKVVFPYHIASNNRLYG